VYKHGVCDKISLVVEHIRITKQHLTMGRVVREASCPWGKLSVGRVVRGTNCPWGKLSVGRTVRWANCPWGELSVKRTVGELSVGRTVRGANCPRGELSSGASFDGANFDGASIDGASFDGRVVREPSCRLLTVFCLGQHRPIIKYSRDYQQYST
jgi:hypothetical protein